MAEAEEDFLGLPLGLSMMFRRNSRLFLWLSVLMVGLLVLGIAHIWLRPTTQQPAAGLPQNGRTAAGLDDDWSEMD